MLLNKSRLSLGYTQSLILLLAFPFWMLAITMPQIRFSSWQARQEVSDDMVLFQSLGLLFFLACMFVFNNKRFLNCPLARFNGKIGASFFCFFVFVFLSVPSSAMPIMSGTYAFLTFFVFLGFSTLWENDNEVIRLSLLFASVAIFSFMLLSLALHGMPGGRTVGGIVPNRYGKMAFAAMVLAYYSGGHKIRFMASFLAISLAVLVSSRSSLLVIFIFLALYYALNFKRKKNKEMEVGLLMCALSLLLGLILSSIVGVTSIFSPVIEQFAVFDSDRGINSGFTGRTEHWEAGLNNIFANPLGYGFRGDKGGIVTAHNGYLNMMLDVGVFGLISFLVFVFFVLVMHLKWMFYYEKSKTYDEARKCTVIMAMVLASLALWMSEPSYINIGLEFSIVFILMLSHPPMRRESA